MKIYRLVPLYDEKGDTVFRSVGLSDVGDSMPWAMLQRRGRAAVREEYVPLRFDWRDPAKKAIADFPGTTELHAVFSRRAVEALRDMLEPSGDFYELVFAEDSIEYWLYRSWSELDVVESRDTDSYRLRNASFKAGVLPDVFTIPEEAQSLFVSERFKERVEKSHLTGMRFEFVGDSERGMG